MHPTATAVLWAGILFPERCMDSLMNFRIAQAKVSLQIFWQGGELASTVPALIPVQ